MSQPKLPFDVVTALDRIRQAVAPYPKAAMFELAEKGYRSLFEQLVACIVSIRTYDEVSLVAAQRLFEQARTPQEIGRLDPAAIDALIYPSTFHERKAVQIRQIARQVVEQYAGELPCDAQVLMSFSGVGVKCTNLALGIACGQSRVSVDIHVHRVTNRWGYVQTSSPEQTTLVLEQLLPPELKLEINRLLVPFGKHICTGRLPRCSTCPVVEMCMQVGVKAHR